MTISICIISNLFSDCNVIFSVRLLLIGGKNQKQLLQLQREIGFSYVRFHGIFHDDMAVYREDEAGEPAFWFGYVDSLMDFLLPAGLIAFCLCSVTRF